MKLTLGKVFKGKGTGRVPDIPTVVASPLAGDTGMAGVGETYQQGSVVEQLRAAARGSDSVRPFSTLAFLPCLRASPPRAHVWPSTAIST